MVLYYIKWAKTSTFIVLDLSEAYVKRKKKTIIANLALMGPFYIRWQLIYSLCLRSEVLKLL